MQMLRHGINFICARIEIILASITVTADLIKSIFFADDLVKRTGHFTVRVQMEGHGFSWVSSKVIGRICAELCKASWLSLELANCTKSTKTRIIDRW